MNKEILSKTYLTANDIKELTGFGLNTCREIIKEIQEQMKKENYYIPPTRKRFVLTKLVIKKLGL